jgi:hypothetical protein
MRTGTAHGSGKVGQGDEGDGDNADGNEDGGSAASDSDEEDGSDAENNPDEEQDRELLPDDFPRRSVARRDVQRQIPLPVLFPEGAPPFLGKKRHDVPPAIALPLRGRHVQR